MTRFLETNRRRLIGLAALAATSRIVGSTSCGAADQFKRDRSRITGISLSAYSMRRHLNWFKGDQTDGELDLFDFIDFAAAHGFDGVELTSYFFPDPFAPSLLANIKRRCHLQGLDITGGAIGNNFAYPPDSESARKQIAETNRWIDHYATLGAPVLRIFGGRTKWSKSEPEKADSFIEANLRAVLPHAEERGVMLGLENHDSLIEVERLLRIIQRIDSPWLGVTWDSGNLAVTSNPYAQLARIAPYAINAQLKVKTRVNDLPVDADIDRLLQILEEARYRGQIVIEYEESEDPFVAIPRFLGCVQEAKGRLSDGGG